MTRRWRPSRAAVAVLVAAGPAAVALAVGLSLSTSAGVSQAYRTDARQLQSSVTGGGAGMPGQAAACPAARGYAVADAGTAAWSVKLPGAAGRGGGSGLPPVALDGLAVFAHGNVVSAWRLDDGDRAWQRAYPGSGGSPVRDAAGPVGGLWAWHGELIVLIAPTFLGEPRLDMRVQALDPATGAVRWTADLGLGALYNEQTIAGGVLALLTEAGASGGRGRLMAVSLTDGRLLWTRPYGQQEETDGPDADGSVIIVAEHGTVTAFDARTGARLWSRGRLPGTVGSLPGPDGLALLYTLQQPPLPAARVFPVIAVDARTGAVRWRVAAGGPVDELTTAGGLVLIGTSAAYRLTAVRPDGQVAWSAPELVPNGEGWAARGSALAYVSAEPPAADPGTSRALTRLVDRQRATGAVRWSDRLADYGSAQAVAPRGPNLIVVEDPGISDPHALVLAVDGATGRVRATLPLALDAYAAPAVAGSRTLIEAATTCAVPGGTAAGPVPAATSPAPPTARYPDPGKSGS